VLLCENFLFCFFPEWRDDFFPDAANIICPSRHFEEQ
jgi:hypothetical protein